MGGRGGSELRRAIAEVYIRFACCVEGVSYQLRLSTLLATWRRDKAVPTVHEAAVSCLNEDWRNLWLVAKRRYQACKHHFKTRLRMRYSLLVGGIMWRFPRLCRLFEAVYIRGSPTAAVNMTVLTLC